MVEFRTLPSYHPLDRGEEFFKDEEVQVEKPILPISQLGATIPEHDPSFKNMVQTVQANIRRGAGTMQLMLQTSHESAIGGRPKAYGKEIREAIREVIKANEVNIKGIEMPTQSLNNVSGFDHQQRTFDEEKRRRDVDEVKSAIKFAADIGNGGGIDLVSFEFPRPINDASWQPRNKKGFVQDDKTHFWNPAETKLGGVVDTRNGSLMLFKQDEALYLTRDREKFHDLSIDPKTKKIRPDVPTPQKWEWNDFVKWANTKDDPYIQKFKEENEGRYPTPEELYFYAQIDQQINQYKGTKSFQESLAESETSSIKGSNDAIKEIERTGREVDSKYGNTKEEHENKIKILKKRFEDSMRSAAAAEQQIQESEYRKKRLRPIKEYGANKSYQSYAELGINALQETRSNPNAKRDLYVGPEIGWPHSYGGHPKEFIEIVKKSRKRMVNLLTKKKMKDPMDPTQKVPNPYFDPNVSKDRAKDLARRHIKGMFDTGHAAMWWEHWKQDPKRSEGENFKDFENWYLKEVDDMIKDDVIGGVQAVDSMTAAHGHLPPGQGIFGRVIKESLIKLKQSGWTGMVVSEGHEEEKFGEGRILYKTWEHLGGYPGKASYSANIPGQSWSQMQHSYMGRTYSPLYMFGSYAPSNEFKLWSEVPLE